MTRAATARLAVVAGAALLGLAALSFALFLRIAVAPVGELRAGARSQAFVSGLFFAAMGLYLVAAGRSWGRPERVPSAAPARDVRPVPVPPEEAELSEGAVSACLRCGSVRMRPLTLEAGLAFGSETLAWVCARCHWRGQPLAFDSVTSYRAFVKGLHEESDRA